MGYINHHLRHQKAFKLKHRHFNALIMGFLAWGFSLSCLAQNTAPNNAPPVVLIVGDSLSAEYGLRRGSGWVALLQAQIDAQGPAARVVNASISGDTTSGGRSRLAALLRQHQPKVVIIELGGNDALRGLPLTMTQDNLSDMTRRSKAAGARVLLLGMEMPPNYGTQYSESFKRVFTQVAQAQAVALVPFFLTGVADAKDPLALFQSDRIHPNEQAQPIMMRNVWPSLRRLLSQR
jgi:acyl-CoA thioesterase-1